MRLGVAKGLRACYHPAPRQQHTAIGGVAALHDSTTRPPQAPPVPRQALGRRRHPAALVHISRADNRANVQADRVDENMSLAVVFVVSATKPHGPVFTIRLSMMPGDGRAACLNLARGRRQGVADLRRRTGRVRGGNGSAAWCTAADRAAACAGRGDRSRIVAAACRERQTRLSVSSPSRRRVVACRLTLPGGLTRDSIRKRFARLFQVRLPRVGSNGQFQRRSSHPPPPPELPAIWAVRTLAG